jgi:hypothetical protein
VPGNAVSLRTLCSIFESGNTATTEIQHARRWIEPGGRGQLARGENATRMELVEWGELSDRQRLTLGRDRRECRLMRSVRPVAL